MELHNLIQGSPAWLAYRLEHDNASEAAAMLGLSKTTTRSELMRAKHTGLGKEFSDWVQRNVLDYGHEVEGKVRPLIEAMIGDDLYPVTCSNGLLSASVDGLTMGADLAFECKQWNAEIAAQVASGIMPEQHIPQCQQILMVTGAQKLIFAIGDGTPENLLTMDVLPDSDWFDRIRAGWKQFNADRAAYVPTEIVAEAVGRTPETLPALHIVMRGEISESNLAEFKQVALTAIRSVNRDLKTDQDFADSAKARKWCEDIEGRVAAAKDHALGQTKTIDDLFRTMDEISNEARDVRLALEKLEKARKESRRGEIVAEGAKAFNDHIKALNARLAGDSNRNFMPIFPIDFGGSIKGLRTFDSMQNAVDTTLANAKISASAIADKIQTNLTTLRELAKDHVFLFADTSHIVLKEPDDLTVLVKLRISEHQAAEAKKEADQRERIRAEEKDKAEKAAREAKEAEDALVLSFEKEARRIEFDSVPYIEKASLTYESTAKDWEHDPRPRIAAAYAAGRAYLKDRLESAKSREEADAKALAEKQAQDAITAAQAATVPAPVPAQPVPAAVTVRQVVQPLFKSAAPAAPTLGLGMMSNRLGFQLTAAFIASLGFDPAARVKTSVLYHEHQFNDICQALIDHISSVCALQAA